MDVRDDVRDFVRFEFKTSFGRISYTADLLQSNIWLPPILLATTLINKYGWPKRKKVPKVPCMKSYTLENIHRVIQHELFNTWSEHSHPVIMNLLRAFGNKVSFSKWTPPKICQSVSIIRLNLTCLMSVSPEKKLMWRLFKRHEYLPGSNHRTQKNSFINHAEKIMLMGNINKLCLLLRLINTIDFWTADIE